MFMLKRYLLAAIAAVLYFLAFVGFEQWYLAWICLVPLFFALDGVSARKGFFIGWFFGIVALTGGFYWVTYTIHVFAGMSWVLSGLGCLLLSIAQGAQFAVFGLLYSWLRKRTRLSPLILGTVTFVSAEFVSPQLFPHYFANSQYLQLPLIQICDITGVAGLTALLVLVNAVIFVVIRSILEERRFRWAPSVVAACAVAVVLGYGYLRLSIVNSEMKEYPKLRIGIAQVNLGIRQKNLYPQRAIRLNQEMTRKMKAMGANLVVWPETAVQEPVLPTGTKKLPHVIFDDLDIPVLTGVLQMGAGIDPPAYNVAVLADENGDILGTYRKQKLLMLGEYIPLGKTFPKLYEWFPYISGFTPGDSNEPLKFRGYKLNVNICYEEILPRMMRRMAAYSPNVFINLTNDNWFGRTHEPLQHFALSIFRTVEHRRWLVRSTNTGISAFVDATGKIVEQSPLMEAAMLVHDVPMMKGETIYTRFGDWFAWSCIAGVFMFALWKRGKP